jgi:mannose-6-phosphate isomerase
MGFYTLLNPVKHYDWGSPRWIPELLGLANPDGRPWAELWMGVHPGGPSRVFLRDGESLGLGDLIASDKRTFLGEETEKKFGALPFLFKVLAAAQPLSIQAHPNREQAREGYERENREGIPPEAPERNYRDPSHKPEILCALSPFTALCGFREEEEIAGLLEIFLASAPPSLRSSLGDHPEGLWQCLRREAAPPGSQAAGGLRGFFSRLFTLSPEAGSELGLHARREAAILAKEHPEYRHEWECCAAFAELHPGDPALISPLYLNLFTLSPGEAVFIPAGILHAYVRGLGMELMAASDNVLRGGLTPKHVDRGKLERVLCFSPRKPERLAAPPAQTPFYAYPGPCGEFTLSVMKGGGDWGWPIDLPAIALVTEGELFLSGGGEAMALKKGDSVFIPPGNGRLTMRGTYTLYAASPRLPRGDAEPPPEQGAGSAPGGRR